MNPDNVKVHHATLRYFIRLSDNKMRLNAMKRNRREGQWRVYSRRLCTLIILKWQKFKSKQNRWKFLLDVKGNQNILQLLHVKSWLLHVIALGTKCNNNRFNMCTIYSFNTNSRKKEKVRKCRTQNENALIMHKLNKKWNQEYNTARTTTTLLMHNHVFFPQNHFLDVKGRLYSWHQVLKN